MRILTKHNPELEKRKELYRSTRWRQFRAKYLKVHKKCALCGDAWATVLDHKEGHGENWKAKFWTGPFQGLCSWCHNRKTLEETGRTKATRAAHTRLKV